MPTPHPHAGARTFSQVLNDLGQGVGPRLTLHEVVDSLGERGFGALILILSLVALVPWPPGGKALFGIAIILMAVQLAMLRHDVWLPAWAGRRGVSRDLYRRGTSKVLHHVARFEGLSRPRLLFMTGNISDILIGLTCVLMSIMMGMSVPLVDALPDIAMVLFGLGLMSRDGAILIFGWLVAVASLVAYALTWQTIVVIFGGLTHWLGLAV